MTADNFGRECKPTIQEDRLRGRLAKAAGAALLAASALTAAWTAGASAQTYPNRPVTIVVGSAPGGTTDFAARILGEGLSRTLGQQFIVENKGGASGNIGNQAVARAAPDGYTLLMAYSGYQVTNPALYTKLSWDPVKDFQPITMVVMAPHVVLAANKLGVKTLKELSDLGKSKPGGLTYASSGIGSIQHIGGEQFGQLTGTKTVHVPYRGAGSAMNDLLTGNVDMFITTPPSAAGHLAAKSLTGIALAAEKRHPMLPDIPTAAEAGVPGFNLVGWFALFAPAKTPPEIVEKLTKASEAIIKSPDFQKRVEENGAYAVYMTPAELAAFQAQELSYWGDVIRKAGIKLE